MVERRRASSGFRALIAALAAAHLLTIPAVADSGDAPPHNRQRGRGSVVSPHDEITACDVAVYRGAGTALYSNRPYHTTQPIEAALGLHFCRGPRHGTQLWILEVSQPTTFTAFGNAAFELESRGWTRSPTPLRVEAAGVALDAIYTKAIPAGRHVIRQGFSPTAPVILWDSRAVRVAR